MTKKWCTSLSKNAVDARRTSSTQRSAVAITASTNLTPKFAAAENSVQNSRSCAAPESSPKSLVICRTTSAVASTRTTL